MADPRFRDIRAGKFNIVARWEGLLAARERFGRVFGLFVGEYLIDLTLRSGGQTAHDSDKSFEIQRFDVRFLLGG
jgi:hypothetical protein